MPNMELFTKLEGRDNASVISINTRGLIGLSAGCRQRYFGNKDYAQLFMSPEKDIIGIKPCSKAEPHAFKLIKTATRPTAHIFAKAFLDFHHIDRSVTRRFFPEWDDKEEMLMIQIKDGVDVR